MPSSLGAAMATAFRGVWLCAWVLSSHTVVKAGKDTAAWRGEGGMVGSWGSQTRRGSGARASKNHREYLEKMVAVAVGKKKTGTLF